MTQLANTTSLQLDYLSKQTQISAEGHGEELMRLENLSFRVLRQENAQEAVQLLSHDFGSQQPAALAFFRNFPEKVFTIQDWRLMWSCWIDEATTNGLSIGVFDLNLSQQLVGLCIVKDMTFSSSKFDQLFCSDITQVGCICDIANKLVEKTSDSVQELLTKKGTVTDIWAVSIKTTHCGKGLLKYLLALSEYQAIKQGYGYSFCLATNFKTGRALSKVGYETISQIDAASFETRGIVPFANIEELHRYTSIWWKKFNR